MKKAASTHTASPTGLAGLWRRWFGASESTAPQRKAAAPVRPALGNDNQPRSAEVTIDPRWLEHCPAFAAHAQALNLPFAAAASLTPGHLGLVDELAVIVRAQAAATADEPSAAPAAALRVLQLAAQSDLEVTELNTAIQQDPALTAAVLRAANAAALSGAAGATQTVRDSVTRLGVREAAGAVGLVATQALFNPESMLAQRLFGARLRDLHVAAFAAASGAAQLSMERRMGRSDWAFLGGMLHDVGKSLALGALARSIGGGRAPADVPEPVLEALLEHVHVELGREAHARWQLPDYLRELCAEHHAQTCPLTDDTRELHLVRVVSGLYALRARTQPIERVGELANSLVTLAFTPAQVRAIDTGLRSRATQARQILER